MPLPSRNLSEWIYAALVDVPGLARRDTYVDTYRSVRVTLLRAAIEAAAPRAVVFVGLTEAQTRTEIAGVSFAPAPQGALWARSGATRFVIVKHPTAFGARNSYFEAVGRRLAE